MYGVFVSENEEKDLINPRKNFEDLDDYDLEEMSIKEIMEELPDGQVIKMMLDEDGNRVHEFEKAKEFEIDVLDQNGRMARNFVSERRS